MRRVLLLVWIAALALLPQRSDGAAAIARKKAPARKVTAVKKPTARPAARKAGKKTSSRTAKRTTWRNRQLAPAPERYKEIQDALAAKGYLTPVDATGVWGASSVEALRRFQADQNLETSGKINSLSLIALGLGPKHDGAAALTPGANANGSPEQPGGVR